MTKGVESGHIFYILDIAVFRISVVSVVSAVSVVSVVSVVSAKSRCRAKRPFSDRQMFLGSTEESENSISKLLKQYKVVLQHLISDAYNKLRYIFSRNDVLLTSCIYACAAPL